MKEAVWRAFMQFQSAHRLDLAVVHVRPGAQFRPVATRVADDLLLHRHRPDPTWTALTLARLK